VKGICAKKIAVALITAVIAVTPALAGLKKKENMTPEEAQRDAAGAWSRMACRWVLPSWLLPVYFHMHDKDKYATKPSVWTHNLSQ
jgi:hypothetical protein